ncbi:hypothetical protein CRENBAI_008745 [Crenichthys baileyi]|uniref:Uncharacterized protein n=1 Tax=Crenichthys baileyi TaxID=28760 RepID=A0AAV9R0U5_9TELE
MQGGGCDERQSCFDAEGGLLRAEAEKAAVTIRWLLLKQLKKSFSSFTFCYTFLLGVFGLPQVKFHLPLCFFNLHLVFATEGHLSPIKDSYDFLSHLRFIIGITAHSLRWGNQRR